VITDSLFPFQLGRTMDDDIDLDDYIEVDDTELDFDIDDFDLDIFEEDKHRYNKPKFNKNIINVKYKNAVDLVKEVKIKKGEQIHCIVNGSFIFGDFIEALLVEKKVIVDQMDISTLSMSQDNIDSLNNLLIKGYIKNLNLIVSNFWYSHEKADLIPYLYKELDYKNRFQLAVCRNHTKIILMKVNNSYFIMSGSANLRSSKNDEMFMIQESKQLYDFYNDWFIDKLDKYSVIDKKYTWKGEHHGK